MKAEWVVFCRRMALAAGRWKRKVHYRVFHGKRWIVIVAFKRNEPR